MNAMAFGFRAHTAKELANETSESFVVIRRFHVAISLITVFGGGVFVMAIALLKVEDRGASWGAPVDRDQPPHDRQSLLSRRRDLAGSGVRGDGRSCRSGERAYRSYYDDIVFSRIPGSSSPDRDPIGPALASGLAAWARDAPLEPGR
jgi:hypothetical protein